MKNRLVEPQSLNISVYDLCQPIPLPLDQASKFILVGMTIPNPGNLHQFSRVLTIAHIDIYCIIVAIFKIKKMAKLTVDKRTPI